MMRRVLGGLTLRELARQAFERAYKDNAFGRAAELAYYFLLALFPMLIFLISVFGRLRGLQQELLTWLSRVMPSEAMGLVNDWVRDVADNSSRSLLSLGLFGSLWAASSGVGALIGALNTAYEVAEDRPYWKARLLAIGLTVALCIFLVGGTALIMFGDLFAERLAVRLGLGAAVAQSWRYVDYLLGMALLWAGIEAIYYLAPNVKGRWQLVTPGALFAVFAFIFMSILFSRYLRIAPSYSATYGSLGAVIVLMLWLYLLGLILFLGAEINSVIERASGVTRARELA
jgi:membrane protein